MRSLYGARDDAVIGVLLLHYNTTTLPSHMKLAFWCWSVLVLLLPPYFFQVLPSARMYQIPFPSELPRLATKEAEVVSI